MDITYSIGEVVLVAYENDELNRPVILGLLARAEDSNATTELNQVEGTINEINDKLTLLEEQGMYTHIKYSNDNGATFTSLFDYNTIAEDNTTFFVYSPTAIDIDPNTQYVQWNIIDSNNFDVTEDFDIETSIEGYNSQTGFRVFQSYTDTVFQLPLLLEACDSASISFTIKTTAEELSNYYISLSTDKIAIGDAYGDYIGMCASTDANPSLNTSDYTWTSVKDRSQTMVHSVTDSIIDRVRQNEQDLRGYSEDVTDSSGNIIETNLGLLDAISIELDSIIVGLDRQRVYFSNSNQYIDTGKSSLHINSVVQHEFNLERYAKLTPTIITTQIYAPVLPQYVAGTRYWVYQEGVPVEITQEIEDQGGQFPIGVTIYTREEYEDDQGNITYNYIPIYPELDPAGMYYTKNGEQYDPATPPFTPETTQYYIAKDVQTTGEFSVEPHLRLTFTEA